MSIKINEYVKAQHWEMWSMCLWGKPKMEMICGDTNCSGSFETRDHYNFNRGREDSGIIAKCPYCGKWNLAKGVVYE